MELVLVLAVATVAVAGGAVDAVSDGLSAWRRRAYGRLAFEVVVFFGGTWVVSVLARATALAAGFGQ